MDRPASSHLADSQHPDSRHLDSRHPDSQHSDSHSDDARDTTCPSQDEDSDDFALSPPAIRGRDSASSHGLDASVDKNNDRQPPWGELKTKAGKTRKRLPQACATCRGKKIRCSGGKPSCQQCDQAKAMCWYKPSRRGKGRTEYSILLAKRLKRMEESVARVVGKGSGEEEAGLSRTTEKPVKTALDSGKKRGLDEAFGPDLDIIMNAKHQRVDGAKTPRAQAYPAEGVLFHDGVEALPPADVQNHLAGVFFESVYCQMFPLLHKATFFNNLRNKNVPPVLVLSVCAVSARFSLHPRFQPILALYRGEEWAVAARNICMRLYDHPHIALLTSLVLLSMHEFGTCHGQRAWALSGQAIRMSFALGLNRPPTVMTVSGASSENPSRLDEEIGRRAMWSCFLLDRLVSSGQGRPASIADCVVDGLRLPVRDLYFDEELLPMAAGELESPDRDAREHHGPMAYIIKAMILWGKIMAYLNHGGRDRDPWPPWDAKSQYGGLMSSAERLASDLPQGMRCSIENIKIHETERTDGQLLLLHVLLQQNMLFLSLQILPGQGMTVESEARDNKKNGHRLRTSDMPGEFMAVVASRALEATKQIAKILSDSERRTLTAPFAGYAAYCAACVNMSGARSTDPDVQAAARQGLAACMRFLDRLKQYWGAFDGMVQDLQKKYRQADVGVGADQKGDAGEDCQRKDAKTWQHLLSAGQVLGWQYGDWLERYPRGTRGTAIGTEKGQGLGLESHAPAAADGIVQPPAVVAHGGHNAGGNGPSDGKSKRSTSYSAHEQKQQQKQQRPLRRTGRAQQQQSTTPRYQRQPKPGPLVTNFGPPAPAPVASQPSHPFTPGGMPGNQTAAAVTAGGSTVSFSPMMTPISHHGASYHVSPNSPAGAATVAVAYHQEHQHYQLGGPPIIEDQPFLDLHDVDIAAAAAAAMDWCEAAGLANSLCQDGGGELVLPDEWLVSAEFALAQQQQHQQQHSHHQQQHSHHQQQQRTHGAARAGIRLDMEMGALGMGGMVSMDAMCMEMGIDMGTEMGYARAEAFHGGRG